MSDEGAKIPSSKLIRDNRKAETDRTFREMEARERKERLEKTMRLRKLRLVQR